MSRIQMQNLERERKRERERESGARERDTEFANRANGPEGLVGRRRYKYRLAGSQRSLNRYRLARINDFSCT